jgi:hypothetical protein
VFALVLQGLDNSLPTPEHRHSHLGGKLILLLYMPGPEEDFKCGMRPACLENQYPPLHSWKGGKRCLQSGNSFLTIKGN